MNFEKPSTTAKVTLEPKIDRTGDDDLISDDDGKDTLLGARLKNLKIDRAEDNLISDDDGKDTVLGARVDAEMEKVIAVVKSYSDSENEKLRKRVKELKTDNSNLAGRIRDLERELYDSSPKALTEKLQTLKRNNEQLKEANHRWNTEWVKIQNYYETRITDIRTERDKLVKKIGTGDKRIEDLEEKLALANRRAWDERNAKEEASLRLTSANKRLESLQTQLTRAEKKVDALREKTESETKILERCMTADAGELKAENDVLKQQLIVFQEDFDKERKRNEQLKKRANQAEQKYFSLKRTKAPENNGEKITEGVFKGRVATDITAPNPSGYASPARYGMPPTFDPSKTLRLQNGLAGNASSETEFRAGSWTCNQCTYVNYSKTTACEMCGYIRNITKFESGLK